MPPTTSTTIQNCLYPPPRQTSPINWVPTHPSAGHRFTTPSQCNSLLPRQLLPLIRPQVSFLWVPSDIQHLKIMKKCSSSSVKCGKLIHSEQMKLIPIWTSYTMKKQAELSQLTQHFMGVNKDHPEVSLAIGKACHSILSVKCLGQF